MDWYKLVNRVPVLCAVEDRLHGCEQDSAVGRTEVPNGYYVSTVFLGLDHQMGEGEPILFETMVFPSGDGEFNEQEMDRYSTYQEALDGHWAMVEKWGGKKPLTRGDCKIELDEELFSV